MANVERKFLQLEEGAWLVKMKPVYIPGSVQGQVGNTWSNLA